MRTLTLRDDAYAPGALVDAGVPPLLVRTLLASGPRAVPERPRLSCTGRRRADFTTQYVWGPDARVLLSEGKGSQALQAAALRVT